MFGLTNRGSEIQGVYNGVGGKDYTTNSRVPKTDEDITIPQYHVGNGASLSENDKEVRISKCNEIFCVDQQNVTFHSPDIYEDSCLSLNTHDLKLREIGSVLFSSNVGDINIETETPSLGSGGGFIHKTTLCTQGRLSDKRLCAGLFYNDVLFDDSSDGGVVSQENTDEYGGTYYFLVYPWNASKALNGDPVRGDGKGTRSAVLKRKIISNIKFAEGNSYKGTQTIGCSGMEMFLSDTNTIVKVSSGNYYGNVDALILPSLRYSQKYAYKDFYTPSNGDRNDTTINTNNDSTDWCLGTYSAKP